jgi:hypothetical protein
MLVQMPIKKCRNNERRRRRRYKVQRDAKKEEKNES